MRAVEIKVLKAKLSDHIRLAKAGGTTLVTERDEVVAEIRPARRQPLSPGTLAESLAALAERGEMTLASESIKEWKALQTRVSLDGFSSQEILDDLRKDTP